MKASSLMLHSRRGHPAKNDRRLRYQLLYWKMIRTAHDQNYDLRTSNNAAAGSKDAKQHCPEAGQDTAGYFDSTTAF